MNRVHRERGSALITAIIMMVLAGLIIATIQISLDRSKERTKARVDRSTGVAIVDRALASYEYALESNITGEYQGFRLDATAMGMIAAKDGSGTFGAVAVPNKSFASKYPGLAAANLDKTWMDAGAGGSAAWAVSLRKPINTKVDGWWQLFNVIPPDQANGSVIAYMRTWTATPAGRLISDPRIVRAELRPGRFSDYQILVDGPLVVGPDVNISGRIHTNGYPDSYLVDAITTPGKPILLQNPECYPGAGFSTAAGTVEGSCRIKGAWSPMPTFKSLVKENTGRLINLLRGRDALTRFGTLCGTEVRCVAAGGEPYTISLAGATASVYNAGGGLVARVNSTSTHGLLVNGSAKLSGMLTTPNAKLTIGIRGTGNSSVFGTASLRLTGNSTIGYASGSGRVLGLIVEGDIIPSIDKGSCPAGLNAAVISPSGTLTIPPQFRVPSLPSGSTPFCRKTFTLHGSIATHYAPLLYYFWQRQSDRVNIETGFSDRTYEYDLNLRTTPPPLFPTTGPWQVTSWKDASMVCLDVSNRMDPNCG